MRRLERVEPVAMKGQPPIVWDRAEGYQVFFWIVEQESGEPVGGVRGSEPEEAPPAPSTPI